MKQPLLIPVVIDGVALYQLVEDYYDIPKGLVVDGASVPRFLWSFKPPDGLHRAAALIHDWDYINKGFDSLSRWDCDKLFRYNLTNSGVSHFDSQIMFYGVRLGGWVPWNKPKVPPTILPVRNEVPRFEQWANEAFRNHLYNDN